MSKNNKTKEANKLTSYEDVMLPEAFSIWEDKNMLSEEQRTIIRALPWDSLLQQKEKINLHYAGEILNSSHYGMQKVKDKILQLIAVRQRCGNCGRGILLVGPPGTGKTTIAKSIAKAMNEPFEKLSFQGLISNWEIIGCNATWKNASQGVILDAIIRSKSFSSVICLDEIDKVEKVDGRNCQMALLSLFDSSNKAFVDNYIEIPLDLSNVVFILTANSVEEISPILLDRLDIIQIDGYNENEKRTILNNYIIPSLYEKYKTSESEIVFQKEAIDSIVEKAHTKKGVREIENCADNLFRKGIYLLEMGAKHIPISRDFVKNELSDKLEKRSIGFCM